MSENRFALLSLLSSLVWLLLSACTSSTTESSPAPPFTTLPESRATPEQTIMPQATGFSEPTTIATACPPFSLDTALPVPDEPRRYIGLHFDTLPHGLERYVGFVIRGSHTDYLVSVVVRGDAETLWLERSICHDHNGHPYNEIRAVLVLPTLQEKEKLITGTCRVNGEATPMALSKPEFDNEIVAIGRFEDIHKPPVTISHAWRANPRTESFEVLAPGSVICARLVGE